MNQIQIPKGWAVNTLEKICPNIQPGFAEGQKDVPNGTIHLRMNNISTNFKLNFDLIRTIRPTEEQIDKYKLEKNDVIFNNTNSTALVGKSALFEGGNVCLYSNHLTRLRANDKIVLPQWILLYLQYLWKQRYFEKNCNKWINQASFNNEKLKNLKILFPPIEIQKKIVQKLDYILGQLDEKKKKLLELYGKNNLLLSKKNEIDTLSNLPPVLKNCIQHILDLAITGKLSLNVTNSKTNDEFNNIVQITNPNLPKIPNNWILTNLKSVCDKITDGTHNSPTNRSEGDYPYITAKNIRYHGIDTSNLTYVSEEDHKEIFSRCNPEKNDVLFIKDGATTGLAVINHLDYEFSMLSSVALLKPKKSILDPYYLKNYLNSSQTFNRITSRMTGAAITRVTLEKIKELEIVLPPLKSQKEIVAKIKKFELKLETINTKITEISSLQKNSIKTIERLTDNILYSAFSGKLVN